MIKQFGAASVLIILAAFSGGCMPGGDGAFRSEARVAGSSTSAPARLDQAEALASVNAYRRSFGLRPVQLDDAVIAAARAQSDAMARQGVMSHEAGGAFDARMAASEIGRAAAVENIAWGTRSFAATMQMWERSTGHARNMQSPNMSRMGAAVADGASGPYWTLIMAAEARP